MTWRGRARWAALALPPVLFAVPVLHAILGTAHSLVLTSHPYFGDIGGVGVDGLALRLGAPIFGDPANSFDPDAYTPGMPLVVAGLDLVKTWSGWTLLLTIVASLALIGLGAVLAWRPTPGDSWLERGASAVGAVGMGAIAWWLVLFVAFDNLYFGRVDHVAWAFALGGLVALPAAATGSRRAGAACLACLSLALWTKQTTIVASVVAVAWLTVAAVRGRTRPRSALTLIAILGLVNGAALGILQLASGGWAWFWVVDLPNRSPRVVSYGKAAEEMFHACVVAAAFTAVIWVPLLGRLRSLPRRHLEVTGVLALFVVLDAAIAPLFRQGAGAVGNHFVGIAWALGLLAAIAWRLAGRDMRTSLAAVGAVLVLFAVSENATLQRWVNDVNHLGVPMKSTRGALVEVPPPLVAMAGREAVYHPVYSELSAERLGRAYPTAYSLQWLPRGGVRPGYFLDAILNRRFDLVFLFEDDGNLPIWGAGKYEDDFVWKLNETIRAKYEPAPRTPAIASGLVAQGDVAPYFSAGAYVRRPGPDPAPWLSRCFGPFRIAGVTWSIGQGGGFWCRTSAHSAVLRLVRTRARRSELRADDVHTGPGATIGVRVRQAGQVEIELGRWRAHVRPVPERWTEVVLPAGAQGRLSVLATEGSAADVYLGRATGGRG